MYLSDIYLIRVARRDKTKNKKRSSTFVMVVSVLRRGCVTKYEVETQTDKQVDKYSSENLGVTPATP